MFPISYYLPERTVSNADLQKEFPDWNTEKISRKVGISSRHIASEGETALDMAEKAAEKLFEEYAVSKDEIDFVLLCTQSPDFFLPTSACILQNRLGLKKSIGAFDYNLGCSGFIYGLAVAKGLLSSGTAANVLLITAETYSKHIHKLDRGNRSIFGDAAAATLISGDSIGSIGSFVLGTDGSGADNLIVRNGCSRNGYDPGAKLKESTANSFYTDNHLFMNGPEIFNFTIETIPGLIQAALEKNQMEDKDISYYIFHQANAYMLKYLRTIMDIPAEKFWIEMNETGNTVSSSIPIAWKNAWSSGAMHAGQTIMLSGFGVGYSYGAVPVTL